MINIKPGIDRLELVYTYSQDFQSNLYEDKTLKKVDRQRTKNGDSFLYYIENKLEVRFFEGKGAAKPRTYIKIINHNLYDSKLFIESIELLKRITKDKIEPISIQAIDLKVDIIDHPILKSIESSANYYIENKKAETKYVSSMEDNIHNKTIYIKPSKRISDKPIESESAFIKDQQKIRDHNDRIEIKYYTKSDYLKTQLKAAKVEKSKYQNPEDEYIERLELSIKYKSQKNKERFLLDALKVEILDRTEDFIKSTSPFIIQDIFKEYKDLYEIRSRSTSQILLNYSMIFSDIDDQEYKDFHTRGFRNLWREKQVEYNKDLKPKNKIRRTTKRFSKKIFISQIQNLVEILGEGILEISPKGLDQIILNAGIRNSGDLELRAPDQKRSGKNLYELFIQKIKAYYITNYENGEEEYNIFD